MATNPEDGREVAPEEATSPAEVDVDPTPHEKVVALPLEGESLKATGGCTPAVGSESSSHPEGLSLNYEVCNLFGFYNNFLSLICAKFILYNMVMVMQNTKEICRLWRP